MIALIRIELDEKHLAKETNDIYDRLQGYNSVLMPLPQKKTTYLPCDYASGKAMIDEYENEFNLGYNQCVDEITGESNGTGTN